MPKEKKQLTRFGLEVKIKLIEKGITQRELAGEVGITFSYLSMILYGYRPGLKHMNKIAGILEIDLQKFAA